MNREQGWEPGSATPLFSFRHPWLSQLFAFLWTTVAGTSVFLLTGILTPAFPQLYVISLTDICMADGANGLANIYRSVLKNCQIDGFVGRVPWSRQTHDWKLHGGSIFQTNVWALVSSLALGNE